MKTYGLRLREIRPYSMVRSYKDKEGLTRPFDLVEGAKKESEDICKDCKLFHDGCPKPEFSENMFIVICGDFKK